jgi:hypothetical protein
MRSEAWKSASASVSSRAPRAAWRPRTLARSSSAVCDRRSATSNPSSIRSSGCATRPAGRVRLLVTPLAATMVLAPKLVPFNRRFPDIVLEITTTQEGRTELVAAGFDAAIHLGESIQRDMVAVRVSRDQRLAVVGSPQYFAAHPKPSSPHDLPEHRCINLRGGSPTAYRWEFEKDGEALVVDVSGPLIVDNADLMIRAAIDGLELSFLLTSPSRLRSRAVRSCECSRTGAPRSPATFCTTQAAGSSRRRCPRHTLRLQA